MSNKPVPRPTPETTPFWNGCAEAELRLQHCRTCAHVQFPPRKLCSGCFSEDVEWHKASGLGTVRSWSLVVMPGAPGFEKEVPYLSAFIALDEGPTMLSVIRNCAADDIDFGMRVQVIFEKRSEAIFIPYFQPLEGGEQ